MLSKEDYLEQVQKAIENLNHDPHELSTGQILELRETMSVQEAADYLVAEFLQELE